MRNNLFQANFGKLRAAAAAAVLAGGLFVGSAVPALADMGDHAQKEGEVTIYTAKGGIMQATMTDKTMLDEITRGAPVLEDHTMVVMHNGKFFLVQDHKTSSGASIFERIDPKSMH